MTSKCLVGPDIRILFSVHMKHNVVTLRKGLDLFKIVCLVVPNMKLVNIHRLQRSLLLFAMTALPMALNHVNSNNKLMKGKALRKHSLHEKTEASWGCLLQLNIKFATAHHHPTPNYANLNWNNMLYITPRMTGSYLISA